jgi:hypothetical protein
MVLLKKLTAENAEDTENNSLGKTSAFSAHSAVRKASFVALLEDLI